MTPIAGTGAPVAHTQPAAGVEQSIRFLKGPAGDLFCSIYAPVGGASASLVMCPPILADHPFSYRPEALMAIELARRGVAVWRFHYRGSGYSDGAADPQSFENLLSDARVVVRAAKSASPVPMAIGGTRLGAMVAAALGGDQPRILWEPVADGSAYLREGFRARMIADGGQLNRTPANQGDLLLELRREGRLDLLGYTLDEKLHDDIAKLRLAALISSPTGPVLLLGPDREDDAANDNLAAELRAQGLRVTSGRAGIAEAWWFHRTQRSDPSRLGSELAEAIASWIPRSPASAMVTVPPQPEGRVVDFIEAGEAGIFGLLTAPSASCRNEAALLLWGGGGMPAFGRNGIAATLARRLAARGYHVLQIDYPGRGDSPGGEPADPIDEPTKLAVFEAVRNSYRWLGQRGLSRVLTIGSCQGAVAALNTALAAPNLTGLALLAPPIAERFEAQRPPGPPGLARSALHPRMQASFTEVVRTGIPILLAYGSHDEGFDSFQAALDGELGTILRPAGTGLTLTVTEERIHGYMTVSGQEATLAIVEAWVAGLAG